LKQESLTLAGHAASGLTVGISGANKMGWFDFISANASGISIILGCCSLLCAICFYIVSYRKQTQADKNKVEIELIKKTYRDDHGELSRTMSEIKDLLSNGKSP
jgi:hypothetical protein